MAHVTIPDQNTWVSYPITSSSTGPFTVPFAIFEKADLVAEIDGVDIGLAAFAYTPTSSTTGGYQTGYITLGSPRSNCTLVIYRKILPVRTSDMGPGPKDRDADNTQWDRFQAQLQDHARDTARTFLTPLGESGNVIPSLDDRKGKFARFDSTTGEMIADDAIPVTSTSAGYLVGGELSAPGDGIETVFILSGIGATTPRHLDIQIDITGNQPWDTYSVSYDADTGESTITFDGAPPDGSTIYFRPRVYEGMTGPEGPPLTLSAQYRITGRVSAGPGEAEEITSSANVFTFLGAADYAAMRAQLGLVIGTDVQAFDADLSAWAGVNPSSYSTTAQIAAAYQPISANLTSWAGVTRASGFDTFAATPSSANLRALLSDESGSGVLLFANGALGTPASATLTNATGLPIATGVSGLGTGWTTALAAAIDTDTTLAANSDARIASQKAVKAYADALIAANDAMVYKGVIDCSANPNYSAADRGWTYRVSVAGKIGGASGPNVEVGDILLCLTDGTVSGNHATVGSSWNIIQTNIDGAIVSGGALGTPSSGTLTNCTGLPVSTGISGLGTGIATFLATPSSANLISAVTDETGTGSLVFATSPTLTTPNLGTPSAATLTNATGLPISTGVSGLGTGVATFLATPTSANLRAALTDESGTGVLLFASGALGTPASGALTNCTGLPVSTGISGLGTGVATFLATPSSANLLSAVTDETGSGALVFGTSPTLSTPVLNGLPTGTGVASAASASTIVARDSNANTTLNNTLGGYTTTATAAGTTTLTVGSTRKQFFTGSTTQTVTLPVVSTLTLGHEFEVTNNSSGIVTVQSSGANTVYSMPAGSKIVVTCILTTGTSAASWSASAISLPSIVFASAAETRAQSSTTVALTPASLAQKAAFSAHKNGSSQTGIVSGVWTKITFGTELYDVGSGYDEATNSRWTPPASVVRLGASVEIDGTLASPGQLIVAIYKNGVEWARGGPATTAGTGFGYLAIAADDLANGTDYYEIWVNVTLSSGTATANGTAAYTRFFGSQI